MTSDPMRIIIVGPGRAGMSLALASHRVGHVIEGVLGRDGAADAAAAVDSRDLRWGEPLPVADLIVVAVRDDLIEVVANRLGPQAAPAVHLSGLTPTRVLLPLGRRIGSFHPLQTLPTPETGAGALSGSFVAVTTASETLRASLYELARSIGARPFDLDEADKALYHAGAASVSNFVTTALALGSEAFAAAGVPFEVARPLVETAVAKAFELGPVAALTGPIARGDVGTVAAERNAVAAVSAELEQTFVELARATARLAGQEERMEGVLDGDH